MVLMCQGRHQLRCERHRDMDFMALAVDTQRLVCGLWYVSVRVGRSPLKTETGDRINDEIRPLQNQWFTIKFHKACPASVYWIRERLPGVSFKDSPSYQDGSYNPIFLGLCIVFCDGGMDGVVIYDWEFDDRFKSEGMTDAAWEKMCKEREAKDKRRSQP